MVFLDKTICSGKISVSESVIVQTYVVNNDNPWDFSNFEFAFGGRFTGWGSIPGGNNTWDRNNILIRKSIIRLVQRVAMV